MITNAIVGTVMWSFRIIIWVYWMMFKLTVRSFFWLVSKPSLFLIVVLLVGALLLVQEYGGLTGGLLSAAMSATVVAIWYWWSVHRFTKGMKQYCAAKLGAARKVGVSQWDGMYRCLTDIEELVGAGVGEEDIKREVLLGEKYPRPVALASLEIVQSPAPKLPILLRFRQAKLEAPIMGAMYETMDEMRAAGENGSDAESGGAADEAASREKGG